MSINVEPSSSSAIDSDRAADDPRIEQPLAGDASSGEAAISSQPPSGSSKLKRIAKALLDNLPALISLGFVFAKGSFAIYLLCWCSVSVAIIALVVDFVHCRHRRAAGLEAIFPKMITVTYLVMNAVVLGLLYGRVLKTDIVYIINGCFITAGLFTASLASLLIRKPWVHAVAVEALPPERLEEINQTPRGIAVFKEVMNAITLLWTAIFLVLFCISLACTIWKHLGGSQSSTQITNMVASATTMVTAAKCVQPQVIQKTRERAIERLAASTSATSHV